ncbi:hypothetical protein N7492_004555 [Penicillium capsulatum]|uniref:Uncharacterized protein n=1 Tax=Penicillium capsulatum TaxID=69766 RepID=A0A9W9IE47_9EURO|nr:hypothetical protein N7492_004555 [Penicillium capsulatum]KAJ6136327.1 hypothetical protein N7512_001487 [Penicillium capsulatum]
MKEPCVEASNRNVHRVVVGENRGDSQHEVFYYPSGVRCFCSRSRRRRPRQPWTTCAHYEKLKCDLHGDDNPGPPLADANTLRDYWAERSIVEAKGSKKDADPKTQDPQKWGNNNDHLYASVYTDGCDATGGGKVDGKDYDAGKAVVKVCQTHATGNIDAAHWLPKVCVSNYMDIIISSCKDKGKAGFVNGQVWIPKYGTTLRVTN